VTIEVRAAKRRLAVMIAVNVAVLAAALSALVAYFRFHIEWALMAFAGAMVVGVGAQIWFIAALVRANKGA
jgi:hypothetical protein